MTERVEKSNPLPELGDNVISFGGNYAQQTLTSDAPPVHGGGGGGSMDGWQTSVEKRLDSLDGRLGRVEDAVSSLRVEVGIVKTQVEALPTKDYIADQFRHQLVKFGIVMSVISVVVGIASRLIGH